MSIRGIDSQVMVHRVTDFAKDSTQQLKRGEMNQQFQQALTNVNAQRLKENVIETAKSRHNKINNDKQKKDLNKKKKNNDDPDIQQIDDLDEELLRTFGDMSTPRRLDVRV